MQAWPTLLASIACKVWIVLWLCQMGTMDTVMVEELIIKSLTPWTSRCHFLWIAMSLRKSSAVEMTVKNKSNICAPTRELIFIKLICTRESWNWRNAELWSIEQSPKNTRCRSERTQNTNKLVAKSYKHNLKLQPKLDEIRIHNLVMVDRSLPMAMKEIIRGRFVTCHNQITPPHLTTMADIFWTPIRTRLPISNS